MYGDEFEIEEGDWLGAWGAYQIRRYNRSRTR
jgi:hypothetical protein